MSFKFIKQIRLAAVVVSLIGVVFSDVPLMLIGLLGMVVSYQMSISKIENYLEVVPTEEDK